MTNRSIWLLMGILGWASAALAAEPDFSKFDLSKLPPPAQKSPVTFAADIQPIFEASCVRCHGAQKPKGRLRLDSLEGVLKGGEEGKVVEPGNSRRSLLVVAVARIDQDLAMPPKPAGGDRKGAGSGGQKRPNPPPKPLTPEQIGLVRAWIDQGAK